MKNKPKPKDPKPILNDRGTHTGWCQCSECKGRKHGVVVR